MPMLKQMMKLGVTLVDYERIVDEENNRLIFFGRHAGIAGMINSLWALGLRLSWEKLPNPFTRIQQAKSYLNLDDALQAVGVIGAPSHDIQKLPEISGFGDTALENNRREGGRASKLNFAPVPAAFLDRLHGHGRFQAGDFREGALAEHVGAAWRILDFLLGRDLKQGRFEVDRNEERHVIRPHFRQRRDRGGPRPEL